MNKILILRFSSIGDIVLTSPIIRCVKTQFPNAEVHFICKNKFRSTVDQNPYLKKVWGFENEITEILDDLKKERFDFIIDLHNNLRSMRLKKSLGCPSSTFHKLNFQKWLVVNFKINRLPNLHIVDRYFESVKQLGVKNDLAGLDFFIADENIVKLQDFPTAFQSKYVAFAIGAQHATKKFPLEKLKSICTAIQLPVILIGGPEDREIGEAIKNTSSTIYNACGEFNLQQSASLVQQSELVICHDSGMMHIASALSKKIISVWGNTIPEFGMCPYQPLHSENYKIIEVKNLSCRPCSKIGYAACPKKHFRCMNDISEEEILLDIKKFTAE